MIDIYYCVIMNDYVLIAFLDENYRPRHSESNAI